MGNVSGIVRFGVVVISISLNANGIKRIAQTVGHIVFLGSHKTAIGFFSRQVRNQTGTKRIFPIGGIRREHGVIVVKNEPFRGHFIQGRSQFGFNNSTG